VATPEPAVVDHLGLPALKLNLFAKTGAFRHITKRIENRSRLRVLLFSTESQCAGIEHQAAAFFREPYNDVLLIPDS
jgi:hypothetical protein